ncbi:MAG: hypothetical protein R3E84_04070 [Pseudomonadales bacterium]
MAISTGSARLRERIEQSLNMQARWLGFRWLFRSSDKWLVHPACSPAVWLDGLGGLTSWLARNPDIRIVHVVRRDNVAWIRSKYLSRETGTFSEGQYPEHLRITVDMGEARRRIQAKHWLDDKLSRPALTNRSFVT